MLIYIIFYLSNSYAIRIKYPAVQNIYGRYNIYTTRKTTYEFINHIMEIHRCAADALLAMTGNGNICTPGQYIVRAMSCIRVCIYVELLTAHKSSA